MKKLFVVAVVVSAFIVSCKTQKKAAEAVVPVDDTITDNSFRKPLRGKELFASVTEVIPLDTVYLSKDTLHILTQKITGCDKENFKLVWSGLMKKSLPPQAGLKLFQQADPLCKEKHRFLLTYNLKPLQYTKDSVAITASDSTTTKRTIIKVGGWKNALNYQYPAAKP